MSEKSNINAVFYAKSYHPIQAGSIDGTDVLPHDNAVYRALICSSAGLYDPHGDPKVIGDPYCTLFVGRLARHTDEEALRKAMSRYGRVKNLRLVRHIVTGASRGYAFVEFETEREMRRAYKDAHHSFIDDSEIIVDYNRQQLMPGWIPRRLGGGLGGRKESGQLRFGGRDRPFRAPLRPIPYDDLKRLGIPAPPEGHYLSRFEIPSPPRRSSPEGDDSYSKRRRRDEREEYSPRRRRRRHDYMEDSPTWRHRSPGECDDHDGPSRYHRHDNSSTRERDGTEEHDNHYHSRRHHSHGNSPSRERKVSKDEDDHNDSSRHNRHRSKHHSRSMRSVSKDHSDS